jgi:hypothetical protein
MDFSVSKRGFVLVILCGVLAVGLWYFETQLK